MINSSGDTPKLFLSALLYLLFSLFMMAYSSSHPQVAHLGYEVISTVTAPLQQGLTGSTGWVQSLISHYLLLTNVQEENSELRKQLQALRSRNARLQEARYENRHLKVLLKMREKYSLEGQAASIIGYDPNHWTREIILDRGASDGIKAGQAVIAEGGVVGQVIAVAQESCKALLITDSSSGVDAVIQDSRVRGIVEGNGSLAARWRFVLAEEPVQLGDKIVTSGQDGVFPAGLPIGVVSEIDDANGGLLFKEVVIKPSANFAKLERVLVLTGHKKVETEVEQNKAAQTQEAK